MRSLVAGFLVSFVLFGQDRIKLDTTTFIVLGEGLAAGMANYGLSAEVQDKNFPAQMARQMGTAFPQPLIQPPGLSGMFGLPLPRLGPPHYPQTTVRVFPKNPNRKPGEVDKPTLFVFNLSLPNWKLSDVTTARPVWPLIQSHDAKQTAVNLILGFPALILENDVPRWTQLEYAVAMRPTLALVEVGYYEALEAAATGSLDLLPTPQAFAESYGTILKALREQSAEVIATTIPDPTATTYFTSAAEAGRTMRASLSGLAPGDLITRPGLYAIGNQQVSSYSAAPPPGSILSAPVAAAIRARVADLNSTIMAVATQRGARVYDLAAFFQRVRETGVQVASRRLAAGYLGGFYSLDGVYPSSTGHALIANELLQFLNRTYGEVFPLVDIAAVAAEDPALSYKTPQ